MPHLRVITGSGAAARRLLAETTEKMSRDGFDDIATAEPSGWGALLSENRGRGLWSDRSAVIVEEAERLGVMPKQLAPMLEGPDSDSHIILVCKSEGPSIIPKELAGKCSFLKASSPPPWSRERDDVIIGEAKKHGVAASRGAVSMMKELFEDVGELASEAAFVAGVVASRRAREISAADVEELCLSDGNRNLLKLLDGLCAGNFSESLSSLDAMSERAELLPLISALHNRFRLAMYFALFPKERAGVSRALGVKDYAARNAETAAKTYGADCLRKFVTGLVRITSNDRIGQGAAWRDLSVLVIDLLSGAGV